MQNHFKIDTTKSRQHIIFDNFENAGIKMCREYDVLQYV